MFSATGDEEEHEGEEGDKDDGDDDGEEESEIGCPHSLVAPADCTNRRAGTTASFEFKATTCGLEAQLELEHCALPQPRVSWFMYLRGEYEEIH